MVFQYSYPQADSFPIVTNGVPTTQSSLHELGWSGYPINTIGLKYTNFDEGVSNPNDNDIVYRSGLRDQVNTLHTLNLDFGRASVVPSSVQLNVRINISGADSGDSGDVFVRSVDLYNNKSEIIANYMTGPGSPVYSWAEGSVLSNQSIVLSGSPWNFNSAYLDKLSCNISLSGAVTGNPNLDNFRLAIYAIELLSSGSVGVEMSGVPLFISGPHHVTECLTVIDASGYPINTNTPVSSWQDETSAYIEDDVNWWTSVSSGIHIPHDPTYIIPNNLIYLKPTAISGSSFTVGDWVDNNSNTASMPSWVQAVNSGVSTPVDTSWIRSTLTLTGSHSPDFLFNKPSDFTKISIRFRAETIETLDSITISGINLRDANGTLLNEWNSEILTIGEAVDNLTTSKKVTFPGNWSPINNYLSFWTTHSPVGFGPSGYYKITEIDIVADSLNINSPNFYFHAPTMNNYSGGASACFRLLNNGQAYGSNDNLTISNLEWKNNDGTDIADFRTVDIKPNSSYDNYCVSASSVFYNSVQDRNYLTFNLSHTENDNEHYFNDILISEIEVCVTGLDPVHSSYIPLYVAGLASSNSGLDLYVQGHSSANSGLDLYINGITVDNSSLPLYVGGYETSNSGLSLYVGGYLSSSSGIPLFVSGPVPQSSWMPLFLKAETIPSINANVPLFTYSTTNSGLFSQIPLYIGGSGDTNAGMILFLKNEDSYNINANMPLFLKTIGNLDGSMTVDSGVPLFVGNYYTSVNSGLNLYISNSQQGTSGYIPMSSWMPLYIARDSEGTANRMDLYLKVADLGSGITPLYTFGAWNINSGISLTISNTHSVISGGVSLYNHGH